MLETMSFGGDDSGHTRGFNVDKAEKHHAEAPALVCSGCNNPRHGSLRYHEKATEQGEYRIERFRQAALWFRARAL